MLFRSVSQSRYGPSSITSGAPWKGEERRNQGNHATYSEYNSFTAIVKTRCCKMKHSQFGKIGDVEILPRMRRPSIWPPAADTAIVSPRCLVAQSQAPTGRRETDEESPKPRHPRETFSVYACESVLSIVFQTET